MKKTLLTTVLILNAALCFSQISNYSVGQTSPNWTVTDTEGNSHSLYDITAGGQYVIVMFILNQAPDQVPVGMLNDFYHDYGCNTGDVFAIAVNNGFSSVDTETFVDTYAGIDHMPAVSGNEGGGNALTSAYGVQAYPTTGIIGPNNQFVQIDIWPITTVQQLIDGFPLNSISLSSCSGCTSYSDTLNIGYCTGDSVEVNGTFYNSPTSFTDTYILGPDCDSVITYNISEIPNPASSEVINGEMNPIPFNPYFYFVNSLSGYTYTWSVTNGVVQSGQGTNVLQVLWDNSGWGQLELTLDNGSCTEIIFFEHGTPTGLLESSRGVDWRLFPNPVGQGDHLTLHFSEILPETSIQIFDLSGRALLRREFSSRNQF